MARKAIPAKTPAVAAAAVKAAKPVASTSVRHTAIPKASPAAQPAITHEIIAKRAFEISCGPTRGSEMDNWLRAERELGL
jgi:hypothetical protein